MAEPVTEKTRIVFASEVPDVDGKPLKLWTVCGASTGRTYFGPTTWQFCQVWVEVNCEG